MKNELFPFQKKALAELRNKTAEAILRYERTHANQVISFTAPTGAGKTIIMASLIENILFGDELYPDQKNAIIIWLSDSPQLNEQSKDKIDLKADRIKLSQCVTVREDSFDQEILDDGHIYFLNTQKLGRSSNLTKHGDTRTYTIWETLANTAKEKSDRLYVIIDEAHRGMQGREAGRATSIMQKFLKGSPDDGLEAMPVVIGMSATSQRFNTLVEGIASDTQYVVVTADEVRASGLLKDRIVISYPEDKTGNKDLAVLQAAADEWKNKWDHWYQYCQEQHYAYVNPVLVIQVLNATASAPVSATNLNECLEKIEERTGIRFEEGQVVHAFGDTSSSITVNGLNVNYVAPSAISEDKRIRIVFFKESLSTGWDCPRAETMMSFRRATDATYIAQLLGRMIRTPMQSRILVDESLNDVHLYLPYFESETVKDVVNELQNAEGGDIPADIYGESMEDKVTEVLSVRPKMQPSPMGREKKQIPGQMTAQEYLDSLKNGLKEGAEAASGAAEEPARPASETEQKVAQMLDAQAPQTEQSAPAQPPSQTQPPMQTQQTADTPAPESSVETSTETHQAQVSQETQAPQSMESQPLADGQQTSEAEAGGETGELSEEEKKGAAIEREAVMKAINDAGLLTYHVRKTRINNYLKSLFSLARLLSQSGKYEDATDDVMEEIIKMIREYVAELKRQGKYDDLAKKVMEFELKTEIFDVFGESVDNNIVHHFMSTTDVDIDRQFRIAETKLGNEGVGNRYGRYFYDEDHPNHYKIDVILFVVDEECQRALMNYAEKAFHDMNDNYRRKIVGLEDRFVRQYDTIVSDGDIISKHNFRLPEVIQNVLDKDGKAYYDHLFVGEESGTATIKLNGWEEGVLEEEQQQKDYVCWLRNPSKKPWSLCIPYEMGGEKKPTYPDFIIIRKDTDGTYVIDILEPHDHTRTDNLGKAKGFAEYARQNPGVGRIQLIRKSQDGTGKSRFKRLDMAKSAVRDKVTQVMTNDELDHLFDTDGFFM